MQNSEAVQAWFQGKMASFRILGLVSKNEIRSREFSFSSRSLRVKIINLDLVSMPEIGGNFFSVSSRSLRVSVRNSRSRLDERDWIRETLILVSRSKKRLSLTYETHSTHTNFGIFFIFLQIITCCTLRNQHSLRVNHSAFFNAMSFMSSRESSRSTKNFDRRPGSCTISFLTELLH